MKKYYRIVKESSWIIIGQVAAIVGGLVLVRMLTEYLTPEQYGELALGLTLAVLINQVVFGGVTAGIIRFYSIATEKNDLQGYLLASRQLMQYASYVVLLFGILLNIALLLLGYNSWIALVIAVLFYSILNGYNTSFNSIQNAARQRAVVAFHGGLDSWLKILFALLVIYILEITSLAVIIGYLISSLIVLASQYYFVRKIIVKKQNNIGASSKQWRNKMWSFSWPFSAWGIFTWTQLASDRWALEFFTNTEEVGFFSVLFQLGYYPISMATGMAMTLLGPILYLRSGDATDHSRNVDVHRLVWNITFSCLTITGLVFLAVLFLHEWIFNILVAEQYRVISYFLPGMIIAGGLFSAGQMLALKLMSDMKSSIMIGAKISTACLGIIFNIIGAKVAGLYGIIVAAIAFSFIYLIWMFVLSYKVVSINSIDDTTVS